MRPLIGVGVAVGSGVGVFVGSDAALGGLVGEGGKGVLVNAAIGVGMGVGSAPLATALYAASTSVRPEP